VAWPELEPALSLRTRIMALHDVPPGAGVSYGGVWRATRPSRIATLPVGYADGYPRHVRGAEVLVRGQRAPLAGVVCMDMLMVDVTDVAGVNLGDTVTLVGQDGAQRIDVDQLAGWAGTIGYEVLCGLSKRVPRLYRGEPGTRAEAP
jgi:alanine racemase